MLSSDRADVVAAEKVHNRFVDSKKASSEVPLKRITHTGGDGRCYQITGGSSSEKEEVERWREE